MDSVTLAYWLKEQYPDGEFHYLSFDYGQRHVKELGCAINIAEQLGGKHNVINLQGLTVLLAKSGSVLVDLDKDVPEGHYAEESMRDTVVPNRNSIMLSIATGIAVAEEADFVAAGMHAGDHFIYPDCKPEYFEAFNTAMRLANDGFWKGMLVAPFINITKAEIVEHGYRLGVPYEQTWSCYKGGALHCGKCGTCVERREAFELAGVKDPTMYALDA